MYKTILILVFGLEAVRQPISTVAKVILVTVGAGAQRLYALPLFLVIDGTFSRRQESVYAQRKTLNMKPSSTMKKSRKKRKRPETLAQEANSFEPIFSERTEVNSVTDTSNPLSWQSVEQIIH